MNIGKQSCIDHLKRCTCCVMPSTQLMNLCCEKVINYNHVFDDKFSLFFVCMYSICISVIHVENDVYVEFIYFLK